MPNRNELPIDWKTQAGVSDDIVSKQMPYLLGYRGQVEVTPLPDGQLMIYGGTRQYDEGGQVVYRYNPETQTAQLISLETNRSIQGISKESLMDTIDFQHYLPPERAFEMLAILMRIPVEQVKGMFPAATNYEQILLGRATGSSNISISFTLPGNPGLSSCIYDYDFTKGTLGHVYSNDGKGKVWSKWNDKKS